MPAPEVFLSAAEVSGDLHGGNLLAALRRERPDLRAWGVGGERPTVGKARHKVGVGNVRTAKCDQVGVTGRDSRFGSGLCVTAVAHQGAIEDGAKTPLTLIAARF